MKIVRFSLLIIIKIIRVLSCQLVLHKSGIMYRNIVICILSLKRNQREDAGWPEEVEKMQIFPSTGFRWFFYQDSYSVLNNYFSASSFNSSGCSHDGSLFISEEQYAVFMTSLILTAGTQKVSALRSCFG